MTGAFDVHQAAIAGVGQAKIHDPRVRAHEGRLIGGITAALKQHMPRATTSDVVEAVKEHYRTSGDIVTGDAVCHIIRRARLAEFRAEQAARRDYLTDQERRAMREDWAAIRSWPCDEPGCPGIEPDVPCVNTLTGEPFGHMPGHLSRIRKALTPEGAAS